MTFQGVKERGFLVKLFCIRAVKPTCGASVSAAVQECAFVILTGALFRIRRHVRKYLIWFS